MAEDRESGGGTLSAERLAEWKDAVERGGIVDMVDEGTGEHIRSVVLPDWSQVGELVAEVERLRAIEQAARAVHLGLTCAQDPMDVDERIERLGAVLAGGAVSGGTETL